MCCASLNRRRCWSCTSLSSRGAVQKVWARYGRKAVESPLTAVFLLGSLGLLVAKAATAGEALQGC